MKPVPISDKEKLESIIKQAKISRSELARLIEVSYKTVYRWLDKSVIPHSTESHKIDELFKEYVDLKELVNKLKVSLGDPIKILKGSKEIRAKFILEMTYNSNAIEGSRMTLKETAAAFKGEKIKGKEIFEVLRRLIIKTRLSFY